jgi:hypothetical protein
MWTPYFKGGSNRKFVDPYHRKSFITANKLSASLVKHADGVILQILMIPRKWVLAGFIAFNPSPWISKKLNVISMFEAVKKPKLS